MLYRPLKPKGQHAMSVEIFKNYISAEPDWATRVGRASKKNPKPEKAEKRVVIGVGLVRTPRARPGGVGPIPHNGGPLTPARVDERTP